MPAKPLRSVSSFTSRSVVVGKQSADQSPHQIRVFSHGELLCLAFNGHVFVDKADTAFLSQAIARRASVTVSIAAESIGISDE